MSVTRMILRNGQTAPAAGDLEVAELAVNTLSGDVYTKDENGNVVPVGTDYDDSAIIADLEFEVDQRKAADAKIEGDLQALDVTLNAGLTAEVLARTNADSDLQDQIDGIAGMIISADEPTDVADGTMWLESTTAIVWIYDTDKWIQFPAGGYDDTDVVNAIATKLDADKIWTGTEDEYNALTPDADTLYFVV